MTPQSKWPQFSGLKQPPFIICQKSTAYLGPGLGSADLVSVVSGQLGGGLAGLGWPRSNDW